MSKSTLIKHGISWIRKDNTKQSILINEACPECKSFKSNYKIKHNVIKSEGILYTLKYKCTECDCIWQYQRFDKLENKKDKQENKKFFDYRKKAILAP